MASVIRVLIVDDDALVRVGLSMVLKASEDLEVVGEASDGSQVLAAVERLRPDVVLMDIRMSGTDGLEATESLRAASDGGPAVIMLTTFDSDDHILRALRAGANGFLLKDTPPRQIIDSVCRVAAGESMLSPTVVARLIDRVVQGEESGARDQRHQQRARRARAALDQLTDREREIALAVGAGKSNAEISSELYLSVATIKATVSRILTKLDCANRIQIAMLVHEADG